MVYSTDAYRCQIDLSIVVTTYLGAGAVKGGLVLNYPASVPTIPLENTASVPRAFGDEDVSDREAFWDTALLVTRPEVGDRVA